MVIEDLKLIDDFNSLKPIECPQRGGINFPCVICRECEIGEIKLEIIGNKIIEKTVNSILIHIELGMRKDDELEKFALKRLKAGLSKKHSWIQRSEWEEGDVTVMVDNNMAENEKSFNQIIHFLNFFPQNWRRYVTGAKQAFTKWENQSVKEISFELEKI